MTTLLILKNIKTQLRSQETACSGPNQPASTKQVPRDCRQLSLCTR
jgi:hypothetical protein